jgi:hypothetical protein
MDRSSPPPLGEQDHKRNNGHRLVTLREPDGSCTPPFNCVYHLALAPPGADSDGDALVWTAQNSTVVLDVPMQFLKPAVVEWLDGTRLPEYVRTPEGLARLSTVMPVLVFLGADDLVDGIAGELAKAVHAREVKMKDALVACNHEVAFTRALADLHDQPLPRFQVIPRDTQPTHFVAALVKPGGVIERVEIAHADALVSIARLLYAGPVRRPEEMVLPADCIGFRTVLDLSEAGLWEDEEAELDPDPYPLPNGVEWDPKYLLMVAGTTVNGSVRVYFDKSRRHADDALPASFIHPNVVAGSVVCVLRWEHTVLGDDGVHDKFTYHPEPWLLCEGFASLPEPWVRDYLWTVLGKWIAGGHEVLGHEVLDDDNYDKDGDMHDTLFDVAYVETALRHAIKVSYGWDIPKIVVATGELLDT